jgi:hypothetical protein
MLPIVKIDAVTDRRLTRLSEVEQELGIDGFRKAIWDIFVETFEGLSGALRIVDLELASSMAANAPLLSTVLRARHHWLAIERKDIRELIEATDLLYQSLRPELRRRADHLLRPLWANLGFETVSARQVYR